MQTQLMQPAGVDVPWLECTTGEGEPVERTPIQSVPFSIGRVETADLQIDSGRVSREHAVIIKQGKSYRIRDLGSTNGTLVNGEPIDDVALNDGDMVVIADRQFVFVAAAADGNRRMATQVMSAAPIEEDPFQQVLAARRLQESLLHRGFRPELRKIFDLHSGQVLAYWSEHLDAAQGRHGDWLPSPPAACGASTWQANQLYRSLAAELFMEVKQDELLILSVDAEEVDGNLALASQLAQLRSLVGDENLVVSLPLGLSDTHQHPLLAELRQADFLLAVGDFVGSGSHIAKLAADAPDYLLLAPTMFRGLSGARQRRQLASIPTACEQIGARAIVCGLATREDEETCRELGFQLAVSTSKERSSTTSSQRLMAGTH